MHRQPEGGDGDPPVGYGNPPKQHRFKKGQSGNPKGRPRKTRNIKTEFLEEMSEAISIVENGSRKDISKRRAVLKSIINKAMSGDHKSAEKVIEIDRLFAPTDSPHDDLRLTEEDLRFMREHFDKEK